MQALTRQGSTESWSMEDVFSGATPRSDEEEEALRLAALEKLPTYDKLRKTLLESFVEAANQMEHKEIDVRKLEMTDRQEFFDRVFKVVEEDNEKFLRKFRNRIDKYVEQLRFENLTVEADCFIGNRALPTLPNAARNILESALSCIGIELA
ncbi:ABC transporter G family member 36 [Abeliophyllum distichum]|uniref:ABC transporter G family member 36 n=1 Tax=Abeliophyllum distichum TaxID=126358 RepID=A0ABD1RXI9_9LAMI